RRSPYRDERRGRVCQWIGTRIISHPASSAGSLREGRREIPIRMEQGSIICQARILLHSQICHRRSKRNERRVLPKPIGSIWPPKSSIHVDARRQGCVVWVCTRAIRRLSVVV